MFGEGYIVTINNIMKTKGGNFADGMCLPC